MRARARPGPVIAGGVVLGGLALVALATSGARSGGGPEVAVGEQRWWNNLYALVVLFLYAAGIALCLTVLAARRRDRGEREALGWRHRLWVTLQLVLPTILVVVAIAALWHRSHDPVVPRAAQPVGVRPVGDRGLGDRRWNDSDDAFVGAVLGVVGAFAVGFTVYLRRRGGLLLRPSLPEDTDALGTVIDDSLDALRAEPDPRRAVVAAYARMERALAGIGMARNRAETPFEYLDRVLVELGAGTAQVSVLTDLFERAKFGQHEVTPAMKEAAIDALEELRASCGSAR